MTRGANQTASEWLPVELLPPSPAEAAARVDKPALTPKGPDFEWTPVADHHPDEAPKEAAVAASPRPSARPVSSSAPRRPKPSLDLNGARFDQLCSLGLAPHQAAGLIGRREQRGGFESVHDLDELDGKYGLAREKIEALKNAVAV